MNVFTYLLAKRSFLDQLKHEFEEVIDAFLEIFEMIKDITYGNLVNLVGPDIALMAMIGIGAIVVILYYTIFKKKL